MGTRRGFSLIEVLITIVIIGIMTAYGVSSYARMVEGNKLRKAIENIKIVYNMQKRYFLERSTYFPEKDAAGCIEGDLGEINDKLGILLRDGDFSYTITGTCTGAVTTEYIVEAKRGGSGVCKDKKVTLTQAGGEPVRENCSFWR